jgi:hypothetical protein
MFVAVVEQLVEVLLVVLQVEISSIRPHSQNFLGEKSIKKKIENISKPFLHGTILFLNLIKYRAFVVLSKLIFDNRTTVKLKKIVVLGFLVIIPASLASSVIF